MTDLIYNILASAYPGMAPAGRLLLAHWMVAGLWVTVFMAAVFAYFLMHIFNRISADQDDEEGVR